MKIIKKIGSGLALLGFCSIAWGASPLVDANWVKDNSCNAGVRVLDIRNKLDGGSKTTYMRGHIPCAIHTDYAKDGWRVTVNKVPGLLPPVDKLEKLIGGLGVDNQTHVVIYHAGKNALDLASATRVYWTFKVLGHENVSILDGGFAAYTADKKNPLEKGNKKADPKTFKATLNESLLATKEQVKAAIDGGVTLIDNRPNHQYLGINRHPKATRNGTIPHSKNLPESWLTVNGGGKFRDATSLKKLYQVADISPEGDTINFCNTGHWASLGWFVGSELLGNKQSRLYDGSMVEWTVDSALPMSEQVKL